MKLVSVNIECNMHIERVLSFLKKENPDVICLQELLEEDFELFKKELNLEAVYQPFEYWKSTWTFHTQLTGKKHGVAIFTKKINNSGVIFYVGSEENIAKPFEEYMSNEDFQENRSLLWADVEDYDGSLFRVTNTHLPVTEKGSVTPFQMEVIESLIKSLAPLKEFVLCGDTNAPRGKDAFDRLAKEYKDNIPQEYTTSIDQNLHKTKGIQFMVDALFSTKEYIATDVKLVDGISDHMAVVATIRKVKNVFS